MKEDSAHFIYSSGQWFTRGGLFNHKANAGIFYFSGDYGNAYLHGSTHAVLLSF